MGQESSCPVVGRACPIVPIVQIASSVRASLPMRPELLPDHPAHRQGFCARLGVQRAPAQNGAHPLHGGRKPMATQDIAAALQRVEAVLTRRPEAGVHDDSPAAARWQGGTRVVASHANGTEVASDMPGEFGGTGDLITPGWLFRAGLASCCGHVHRHGRGNPGHRAVGAGSAGQQPHRLAWHAGHGRCRWSAGVRSACWTCNCTFASPRKGLRPTACEPWCKRAAGDRPFPVRRRTRCRWPCTSTWQPGEGDA